MKARKPKRMKQNERQAIWRRLAITFADTQSAVVAVPVRVNQVEVAGALWKMRLLRLERPDPTRAHASWSCLEVA
ncbi:MAG: hypothetical protein KA118_20490 [Verrucomicrobia bacterium]|nr:hypothetical protein [Verrucomicrobiota bacterium]